MNIIEDIEKEQMEKLTEGKNVPSFKPGDTLRVHTKVKEGDRERIQIYEGVCIARKNDGLNSSFTVRKISFGELKYLVSVKFAVPNCTSCAHCVVVLLVLPTICLLQPKLVMTIKTPNNFSEKLKKKILGKFRGFFCELQN